MLDFSLLDPLRPPVLAVSRWSAYRTGVRNLREEEPHVDVIHQDEEIANPRSRSTPSSLFQLWTRCRRSWLLPHLASGENEKVLICAVADAGKRRDRAFGRRQMMQMPGGGEFDAGREASRAAGSSAQHGNIERIQRNSQSNPLNFQDGFLARPAAIKGVQPLLAVERWPCWRSLPERRSVLPRRAR